MINNKSKIAIIIGTRAELIKTFPLMRELESKNIPYYFIHTGQHNLRDLCHKFGVKEPDMVLSKEPNESSKFNAKQSKAIFWILSTIWKVRRFLSKLPNLEYVIYHGDTISTVAASLGSSRALNPFKKYKNVHLEAGLRSWNWAEPFPEEIARVIAGRFSDVLLAVSEQSKKNLSHLKRKKISLVGNTIIDSANQAYEMGKSKGTKRLLPKPKKFALISIHRHENIKSKERMEKIIDIITSINIPSFFAMHGNTKIKLEEFGLMKRLTSNKNIKLLPPMDYTEYIYQIANCSLIICDGGSLQEESLIFKKPCIILRTATERQEGLKTNFQFLSKFNVAETKDKIKEYLSPKFKIKDFKNPYGLEGVSKKISSILRYN